MVLTRKLLSKLSYPFATVILFSEFNGDFLDRSSENTKNETNETFSNEVYGEEKDVKEVVVFLLLGILIIFVNATSIVVFGVGGFS